MNTTPSQKACSLNKTEQGEQAMTPVTEMTVLSETIQQGYLVVQVVRFHRSDRLRWLAELEIRGCIQKNDRDQYIVTFTPPEWRP